MLNKCSRLLLTCITTGLLLNTPAAVGDNKYQELLNILATFQGQIESLTMVPVVTTFYLESGTVKGKYKYVDEGAWDHGTLTDIRVLDRDGCGGGSGQAQSGTAQQTQSSSQAVSIPDDDDEESVSTIMGAAGKAKKKKKKKNTGMVRSEHDLCVRAIWTDRYGDGPVEFRFNPTRDYFSGLYWSTGEEKAVWNGSNIP